MRPSLPKYDVTWDPRLVLEYISQWYPSEDISLEVLSFKLITLLALVTGHRMQTLSVIKIGNIYKTDLEITLKIPDKIKMTAPGRNAGCCNHADLKSLVKEHASKWWHKY